MLVDQRAMSLILLLYFFRDFFHHSGSFAQDVRLLADGHGLVAELAGILESRFANAPRGRRG